MPRLKVRPRTSRHGQGRSLAPSRSSRPSNWQSQEGAGVQPLDSKRERRGGSCGLRPAQPITGGSRMAPRWILVGASAGSRRWSAVSDGEPFAPPAGSEHLGLPSSSPWRKAEGRQSAVPARGLDTADRPDVIADSRGSRDSRTPRREHRHSEGSTALHNTQSLRSSRSPPLWWAASRRSPRRAHSQVQVP